MLAMVPFTPCSIEQGRIYPVMIGHLDIKIVMVSVSAFARKTDEGREFLSLAIGPQSYAYIGTNAQISASGARALSATAWVCTRPRGALPRRHRALRTRRGGTFPPDVGRAGACF